MYRIKKIEQCNTVDSRMRELLSPSPIDHY